MWGQDVGRISDRKWQQAYESSVYRLESQASSGQLDFEAVIPDGAERPT